MLTERPNGLYSRNAVLFIIASAAQRGRKRRPRSSPPSLQSSRSLVPLQSVGLTCRCPSAVRSNRSDDLPSL